MPEEASPGITRVMILPMRKAETPRELTDLDTFDPEPIFQRMLEVVRNPDDPLHRKNGSEWLNGVRIGARGDGGVVASLTYQANPGSLSYEVTAASKGGGCFAALTGNLHVRAMWFRPNGDWVYPNYVRLKPGWTDEQLLKTLRRFHAQALTSIRST